MANSVWPYMALLTSLTSSMTLQPPWTHFCSSNTLEGSLFRPRHAYLSSLISLSSRGTSNRIPQQPYPRRRYHKVFLQEVLNFKQNDV